jgi:hypothetical protein
MAKLNQSKLSREHVEAVFRQLPESTRESLKRVGDPSYWSMRINSILAETSQLPQGFHTLHPSEKIVHCIRQIAGEAALPAFSLDGRTAPDNGSLNRLAQTLGTRATDLTDGECIQSLIEETTAAKANDGHFLSRTPLG